MIMSLVICGLSHVSGLSLNLINSVPVIEGREV